jgi:hypothetical protein
LLNTLLLFLRTAVAACLGLLVWVLVRDAFATEESLLTVTLPVWVAGLAGGVVSVLFAPRQGIALAFTTGVIMAVLFLAFRHLYLGLPLGANTLLTLWPMWFPVAYYLGAYGYLTLLQHLYRK